MRFLRVINIALIALALAMSVNLFQPISAVTGNIIYAVDASKPSCHFYNHGEVREIPLDLCCVSIQKQLACTNTESVSQLKCYTSETSDRYYLVNQKALNYCRKEGFDVRTR